MPSINKIRFTNVVYEDGMKRYNDEIFHFDGFNGALVLENGGGKTVFIQTALQAILPHTNLSERKIRHTLQLDNYPAHIAIEWLLSESPRRYVVTCVSLFLAKNELNSYRYVYPYVNGDPNGIEGIPFVRKGTNRPSDRGEISEYYQQMTQRHIGAETFSTIKAFQEHIEEHYHIIKNEWEAIVQINSTEGGVEAFFDECRQTRQLLDRLLIPTVERAIAGHSEQAFADTFETHRDSFKQYKELKRQIIENQRIENRLTDYVETFLRLDEKEQTYLRHKQDAKAIMQLLWRQKEENRLLVEKLMEEHSAAEAESRLLEIKGLSVELRREEEELTKRKQAYARAEQTWETREHEHAAVSREYHSLQLAEIELSLKTEQERLSWLERELEKIDLDEKLQDLKQQFDHNTGELAGYYQEERSKTAEQLVPVEEQLVSIEADIGLKAERIRQAKSEYGEMKTQFDKLAGQLEQQQSEQEKTRNRLLSNPQQETVSDQLKQWIIRSNQLDEEGARLRTEQKKLQEQMSAGEQEMEETIRAKEHQGKMLAALDEKMHQLHAQQATLLSVLGRLYAPWERTESVYLKQETFRQRIQDELSRLERKREDLLLEERRAHRFKDDYEGQQRFFADPVIERRLPQWSHQVGSIETGIEYIRTLGEQERSFAVSYPLWATTLVTLSSCKPALLQKLDQIRTEMQFPIFVLSTEEARAIVKGEQTDWEAVTPHHWRKNESDTSFEEWKRQIEDGAIRAKKEREACEGRIKEWEQGQENIRTFLETYPRERYESYRDEQAETRAKLDLAQKRQNELKGSILSWKQQFEAQATRITRTASEYDGLAVRIKDGIEYERREKEMQERRIAQEEKRGHMEALDDRMNMMKEEEARLRDQALVLKETQRSLHGVLVKFDEEMERLGLSGIEPIFTGMTKSVLLEQRDDLKRKLDGTSSERNEIQIQIDGCRKKIGEERRRENRLREEHPADQFIPDFVFPENGNERLIELLGQKKRLESEVKAADDSLTKANSEKIKQQSRVERIEEKFVESFADEQPLSFTELWTVVETALEKEKRALGERKAHLAREEVRIRKEQDSMREAERKLEKFEYRHLFTGPSVTASVLTTEQENDFTYGRGAVADKIGEYLNRAEAMVEQEKGKVDREKEAFKTFCKTHISNIKMREMARQGIERKQSYQEIVAFHELMKVRIQTAIKYCDENIMQHDKMLEQYVLHIQNHLRTVVEELALIPRKTKVKTEEKWKEIFKFTIPEWTEEDGKLRIRRHIEWILEELDKGLTSGRFLNSEGQEDAGKVRRHIEMWTHSKQLLQTVMDGKEIRVACRKVTNDNQISTKSYSWDESNAWSGGEKWSKNMALFLGILSYTAEKQKHAIPNMRRHRSVIMDNPFGKASSNHVLSPVFFIAEQLGFQIIALTAHAEGKFLKDYFPVIYSCRLRQAVDSNRQIMTTEKHIHQAFFRDHEPRMLEHIGDMEQLELL
ncbi:coiled-coil domain-containing protein [Exiguobacterium flavidum]|uniref:hypothetical protein n=1 Tax=Exiguobacterium flavidum TaxID=2184695 RepID=UPI000DF80323|nr:hypothetical protein [Exiguobacterium flavidum]